jgi:hypothetical protein
MSNLHYNYGKLTTENIQITSGATDGYILTSDSVGNGIWLPVSTFTGNTSASCITDLWVSNVYGCSPITIHDSIQAIGSLSNGSLSISFGEQNRANGDYSQAGGSGNTVNGNYSFVGGVGNFVSGASSVAFGGYVNGFVAPNNVYGDASMSIGILNNIYGAASLALGSQNTIYSGASLSVGVFNVISGDSSFAQGNSNITLNDLTHAEGQSTTAIGYGSHSEGYFTVSMGIRSHAEGSGTTSFGQFSHSEGILTTAIGSYSHAEGNSTTSFGEFSHSSGLLTIASGQSSHTEGQQTTAIGQDSHAEGSGTVAIGNASHSEGIATQAIGVTSHAEGYFTTTSGVRSHSEGSYTTAIGTASHAEGSFTTAIGSNSHSGGINTLANGLNSFIHSSASTVTGDRSVVLGGKNITGSTNDTVYVPNLNINTAPANDNALTQVLARANDGTIKYRDVSSFTDTNFANTNLTFSGNRSHNTNGNSLQITTDNGVFLQSWQFMDNTINQIGFNTNQILFNSTGVEINYQNQRRIKLLASETVLNDDSNDINFRIEGNTDTHLLFVDAGTDEVAIGTNNPLGKLHIQTTESLPILVSDGLRGTSILGKWQHYTAQANTLTTSTNTSDIASISLTNNDRITLTGKITARGASNLTVGGTFMAVANCESGAANIIGTVDTNIKDNSAGTPSVNVVTSGTSVIIQVTGGGENLTWLCTYEYQIIAPPVS